MYSEPKLRIKNRIISDTESPLVIAEIGINHGGSLDIAIAMADAAINAGAEVVKHQTHIVSDEMSEEAKNITPIHTNNSIFDIMDKCALTEEDEFKLKQHIESRDTIFISTPFSREAADRLESFNVPAYKIGSGECNNYPLLTHIASFGKPVIMSTGMNSIETIKPAVKIFREANIEFALLHCTNVYPTPPHIVRLGAIEQLKSTFPDAVIGLSDHTTSNFTSLGAVALGACILERHFTDNLNRSGPDIPCSMDPFELSELIKGSKIIHSALGGDKGPSIEEQSTMDFAFASVVSLKAIKKGERLSIDNIWVKRPGGGDFLAKDFNSLLSRKVSVDISPNRQIKKSDLI